MNGLKIDWLELGYHTLVSVTFLNFSYIFLNAYSKPSKLVTVDIDAVGEANVELGILILIFFLMVIFWVKYIKKLRKDNKHLVG